MYGNLLQVLGFVCSSTDDIEIQRINYTVDFKKGHSHDPRMLIEFILLGHGPYWILKAGAKISKNYLLFTFFTSFDYLKRNYNYKSVFRSFNMPSRGKIRMILPLCCCNDENFHRYVSINSFKRY